MNSSSTIGDVCNITTGKLDSNAQVADGAYPFFTCAKDPIAINSFSFDDDVVLVAGNNAHGNFHVNRFKGKFDAYQRTYVLTSKGEVSLDYVYYLLKLVLKRLKERSQGSQTKFLTIGLLREIQVPRLENSNLIAKILSDLDAKIELNNKINAELEALAKLIYDYWFVQFDFPDENGKPYKSSGGKMVYNEELKREIPVGWEVKELKVLAKCIMGHSPKGESYNDEKVGMPLLNGPADYDGESLSARVYTSEPTRICNQGAIVLCIRATIGKLTIAEESYCLGRSVAAVEPKNEKHFEYVYQCIDREIARYKQYAVGSIIKGIQKEDLTDSKVLFPNTDLIDRYHEISSPMWRRIRNNRVENQELATLRDWLLPMLMNGQVKVGAGEEVAKSAEPEVGYGDET